ncbi:MAG: hypothetical protein L3J35_04345 [Bacteroidales bacterium]|nr:hypothetical protein [Bacteroidales bacterium]
MKIYFLFIFSVVLGLITSCNKNENITNSVSGVISYNGVYVGQNRTIYIRGYKSNTKAIGTPDFATSVSDAGSYIIDLGAYAGDLYLSAFMDIDNSGNSAGPTANETLINGVYADPIGCYGDYTFENGEAIQISVDGEIKNINFEIKDSGVIKASFSNTGHCTIGVIKNNIISEEFLHHRHCDVTSSNDTFLLAVPAKNNWFCKVKFDNLSTAQIYPSPVNVTANNIVEINF